VRFIWGDTEVTEQLSRLTLAIAKNLVMVTVCLKAERSCWYGTSRLTLPAEES